MQQRGPEGPGQEGQERRRRGRWRRKEGNMVQKAGPGSAQLMVSGVGKVEGGISQTVGVQPGAPTRPGERRPKEFGGGRAEEARRTAEDARRAVGDFLKNLVYPLLEGNKLQREGRSKEAKEKVHERLERYIENFIKQRKPEGFIENLREALESKERKRVTLIDLGVPQLTEEDKNKISELLDSNDVIFIFVKEGERLVGFEVILHSEITGENVVVGDFESDYYDTHKEEIKAFANQLRGIEKKS
jgi:hypothetical protein